MPANTVTLGTVTFTRREVPDIMPWGGKQMIATHKNIGGSRVLDTMGPDPRAIEWSGLFYGPNATVRARLVDAMKDAGQQVQLTWGSFSYQVVIAEFNPVYKHEWEVHYHISCEVVTQGPALPSPTLDQQVNSDMLSLNSITTLPVTVTTAIVSVQSSVNAVAAAQSTNLIQDATLKAMQAAVTAANTALQTAIAAQSAADAAMLGISLDAVVPTSIMDANVQFLAEQTNQALASDLATAIGYLGRIAANLAYAGG